MQFQLRRHLIEYCMEANLFMKCMKSILTSIHFCFFFLGVLIYVERLLFYNFMYTEDTVNKCYDKDQKMCLPTKRRSH